MVWSIENNECVIQYDSTANPAPSFYYELTLLPGDFLLVNNHVVYHARNSYQDGAIQRHLLRYG